MIRLVTSYDVGPRLRALPGVVEAEPLMHRLAYVGSDLQHL